MSRFSLRSISLATLTGLVLIPSLVIAQGIDAQLVGHTSPSLSAVSSFPNTPPEAPHRHSSTAAEGWLRGRAALIGAIANYRLQDAEARILWEQARALAYDNYVRKTEAFYQRKYEIDRAREMKWEKQRSDRAKGLALKAERQRTELYAVYRLGGGEFQPATGLIAWPCQLKTAELEPLVEEMSLLFEQLAIEGAQRDRLYRQPIVELCNEARRGLYDLRHEMSRDDYIACQKFLLGVKYEATYFPSSDTLAQIDAFASITR